MIIDKQFAKSIKSFDCYSERLSVTFETIDEIVAIFQIYAPDISFNNEVSYECYDLHNN